MFNIFPRQQGKPAQHTQSHLHTTPRGLIKVIPPKPNSIPLSLPPPAPTHGFKNSGAFLAADVGVVWQKG